MSNAVDLLMDIRNVFGGKISILQLVNLQKNGYGTGMDFLLKNEYVKPVNGAYQVTPEGERFAQEKLDGLQTNLRKHSP